MEAHECRCWSEEHHLSGENRRLSGENRRNLDKEKKERSKKIYAEIERMKSQVLSKLLLSKLPNITVFIATVGNEDNYATKRDMERVSEAVEHELHDEDNVVALIIPHNVKVKTISSEELSLLSS